MPPGMCPQAVMTVGSGQTGTYPATSDGGQGVSICPNGYGGNPAMTCRAGTWDQTSLINPCLPNCQITPLPVFSNATPSGNGFNEGSIQTYQCNGGFTGTPTSVICQNQQWLDANSGGAPVDPNCAALTCPSPPAYPNASSTGTGFGQGATRSYTCNSGFIGNALTIRCSSGQWIDTATGNPPAAGGPNCVLITTCPAAPAYSNSTSTGTGVSSGDTRTYTCNPGFSGNSLTIICSTGRWLDTNTGQPPSPMGPNCSRVSCVGTIPSNAILCPGDDQDLVIDMPNKAVAACTPVKCEYRCQPGFYPSITQDRCVQAQCLGTQPTNSSLCPGATPVVDTPIVLVSSCGSAPNPCEFSCNSPFVFSVTRCVQAQCTNSILNSTPCPGPAPTVDTPSSLVVTCSGGVPCQFTCSPGFNKVGNLCLQ